MALKDDPEIRAAAEKELKTGGQVPGKTKEIRDAINDAKKEIKKK